MSDPTPYPTAWAYEQACKALRAAQERAKKAEAEAERLARENEQLRQMVEERFDGYDQDGEPVLPRGWVPVDGGRLDELEAAEAESDALHARYTKLLEAAEAAREALFHVLANAKGFDDVDPFWVPINEAILGLRNVFIE